MSTVLILGARSDMARAFAHRFALSGHDLILAARRSDDLHDAVNDLKIRYAVEVHAVEFDALDYASHPAFVDGLSGRPDITICVFGYLGDPETARHDFAEAERIVATNYTGAVSVLNIIADAYETAKQGVIIGISSVAGDRGRQSNYLYGSAKAGFSTYLAGLRNRLAPVGVHVMTVKPGFVATRMTEGMDLPAALTASPERVANDVYRAFDRRRNVVYTMWVWRYIMLIIRSIPEFLFKKLSM